jgi:hypothetical protein
VLFIIVLIGFVPAYMIMDMISLRSGIRKRKKEVDLN